MSDQNSRLVYSTDGGDSRSATGQPKKTASKAKSADPTGLPPDPGDGIVRLHRGKSVRGGKPGTLVVGLPGTDAELDALLKRYKQKLGSGGTRQERVLVIQGDHRDKLRTLLEADGHRVKLAGG